MAGAKTLIALGLSLACILFCSAKEFIMELLVRLVTVPWNLGRPLSLAD